MKSKNHKETLLFMVGFFVIITVVMGLNTRAVPDASSLGCHPGGYTISVNVSNIEAEASSSHTLNVTATGSGVVIDIYTGALDNDAFIILPSNIITDNSIEDLDPTVDSIRVIFNITVPSQEGIYTMRILSRAPTLAGENTPLGVFDIEIMVGEVIVIKTPLTLFLENYNIYLGGVALIFIGIGTIMFTINFYRKDESKAHGIFVTIGFVLNTLNMFLILDNTVTNGLGVNQLIHFSLGAAGYMAGIFAVFGTYTNVPRKKIQFALFIMLLGWSINFLFGIFIPTPILI